MNWKSITRLAALFAAGLYASTAFASPWIEADDVYLRLSVQQLADAGYLRGHVHTYPLMWSGIARDLRAIDVNWLNEDEALAYYRVRAALDFSQQARVNGIRASANSEPERHRGFADAQRETAGLTLSRTFTGQHTAARLQTSLRTGSTDDKSYAFDGSYLATTLGNWAGSIDQIPVWWGPGQDSALVLSTSSRPIQAFRINRLEDSPFELPILRWAGHWHATAFFGRTQSSGMLGDQEIAGARLTSRPFSRLHLGVSYTTQMGDSLGGRNQLAGADVRLSLPRSVALYGEVAQRFGDSRITDDASVLFGMEHYLQWGRHLQQAFIEYHDIPAYFYDDTTDPSGYRRWQHSMGAGSDQDIQSLSVGYRFQQANGQAVRVTLRQQTLGGTNYLAATQHDLDISQGATGFEVDRQMLDVSVQRPFAETLLTIGLTYTRDKLSENFVQSSTSNRIEQAWGVSAQWEFRY